MISGQRETPISGPWDFLGPFGIGKTEIDSDPIAAYGGIRNVSKGSKKRTFVSELADGGLVGWSRPKVSLDGAVTLQFFVQVRLKKKEDTVDYPTPGASRVTLGVYSGRIKTVSVRSAE